MVYYFIFPNFGCGTVIHSIEFAVSYFGGFNFTLMNLDLNVVLPIGFKSGRPRLEGHT